MESKFLFVVEDPGGINALVPVIKKIKEPIIVYASEVAGKILTRQKIPFTLTKKNSELRYIMAILQREKPSMVITGTSKGITSEFLFRYVAKYWNIPTLAVLDQWMNYKQRFFGERHYKEKSFTEHLSSTPDIICVMDEIAKADMIKEGFKTSVIRITGNPYFDDISTAKEEFSYQKLEKVKKQLNTENEYIITFASEPVKGSCWIFQEILGALQNISFKGALKICIAVKLHPKEENVFDDMLRSITTPLLRGTIIRDIGSRKLILSSDLIIGMSSMFLIESVLLGKLVLSIQPDSETLNLLITNRIGASIGLWKKEEIESTLDRLIFDESFKREILENQKKFKVKKNAADNVVNEIYELLER